MFGFRGKDGTCELTRLRAEHGELAAAVHAECFKFAWPQDDFEALLANHSTYANGAFDRAGHMLGFVLSRLAADEAEILTVAVRPKRQNQGIAGRLLRANREQLQLAGAKSWFLEVEAQNAPALALYKRLGFERVGERKSYYRKTDGENATAYILRCSLR